jgi:hypothetical protein
MASAPTLPPGRDMAAAVGNDRYRHLDPRLIIATAETLERRVAERFPDRGLRRVAAELVTLSREVAVKSQEIARPIWKWRILTWLVIAAGVAALLFVGITLSFDRIATEEAFDFVQGIEASLNTVLIAGVGVITLTGLERRRKRASVSTHLYALRSLIHVIDMHQLTKDPSALSEDFRRTSQSPERMTDRAELTRYLDYCSEMLSITGKLAALFAQSLDDDAVARAVNDIEELGSNLSRKIWQKITMIEGHVAQRK